MFEYKKMLSEASLHRSAFFNLSVCFQKVRRDKFFHSQKNNSAVFFAPIKICSTLREIINNITKVKSH